MTIRKTTISSREKQQNHFRQTKKSIKAKEEKQKETEKQKHKYAFKYIYNIAILILTTH